MAIRYQDENGNWVTEEQTAVETTILDIAGNFESENVEGALRELAEKTANAEVPAELEAQVKANTTNIKKIQKEIQNGTGGGASSDEVKDLTTRVETLESDMSKAKDDISYLIANGGGGGGSAVPTITSDFTDCAIDKGSDVVIPIFFTSPNMGDGTAYITVNNIQVDTAAVKQGNNNVRVKAQYLVNTDNNVGIYVKDRAGIVTNRLNWTIIAGGIDLTSTFDYEVDYGITDTIRIPYTIDTGISGTAILHFTIDNNTTEYTCSNGVNYLDIDASEIGLGTHSVSMYATIDKYTSRTLSFNIVIISTTELYLSSTFVSGSEFTYGELVSINYRLSKQSTEEFNVYLKLDDVVKKTQKLTVGSYFWTLNNLPVGPHKITIQVVSLDYSEDKSIDLELTIAEGEYVPVEAYTLGLLCDLNAVGRNNDDDAVINQNKWIDASGNGHDGQLINFNFGTNGFVNDTLVCDNDAYVMIPWSPWEHNALNGSTFDIIYTPINSGVEDCRVLDYTQITDNLSPDEIKPFKGIFADVLRGISSSASSGTSAGKVNLDDENGEIHLTWVLDRINKFMKTYIDGVLCRIMFLTDSGSGVNKFYEDFSLDEYIYLNSTKGLNCGTNNIKRFRVYDHALTSEQVLQNHMANITDLDKQKQMYDFNYNNTTLPKMYLNGDTTNMTAYQTVPMAIEYISPDEERYGQSFNTGIQNNPVKIQGTSSLQYVRHNYTIYLKDEYGTDMYYNPYGAGSVADYVFCLKADYVESSHANNTGCAKFVNDCLYDTKTPMQLDNENCRTAINGFPIEVYMNGEYLGIYNFNHDRYSYQSYGYDYRKYPNMLVYEINSNSNTSAGAFYRYGDNAESSTGITELEYYKRDFNLIYGNRTTDSDTYSEIKTLVEWVSVAQQDLFRETISEHFNTEYLFRYFLMVLLIGAVDSLGKNLKIMTIDGKVWYPTFYDMDTVLGIDNTGYLTIEPDVEIESGSYNTSNSNLWNKVWNFFRQELKEEWSAMRQGNFTLDNLMNYIYGQQISVIPAKYYNDDAEVKYLQFGSLYTYCCHGNKEHQIRRWLRERIAYVDSMLGYFTSQEDQVTIRMNKTGYVSFDITTYIPLYFSVKWSNATGGTQTFKMKRGETKTFYYTSTTSTDQEVIVYHAQYVKALDNLSNLNPSSCILANARKITNVEIHSTELYNINVTNNTFLRTINLEGCSTLGTVTATGSSLDLSNCKYLRYCNVYNTALTEVQLNTSGGSLIEIYYPSTLQSMTLIKQRLLETIGLPYGTNGKEVPTALYTVNIQECPSIKYLNTSDDPTINTSFASIYYCNNLTLRNTLDLSELNFDGFHRLKNVIIENMFNLTSVGFNNLLPVGNTSTLKYVGFSNCPLLEEIELNCTSNDYEISFDTNSVLNFGGLSALKTISSNCVIKGLDTIVLPLKLENMFFTTEYGEGFSEIKNLWSSAVCNVNINGSTVECIHVMEGYEGIDFANMHLINIDLGGLVNIKDAINFSLYPTTVNPNFNKNRDGVTYPYLQPQGTLDLSNYTESLAKFFDGVDLRKLQLICTSPLPQKDLSYCFYNSTFDKDSQISAILDNLDTINNMEYCFYKTSVKDVSILNTINFLAGTSLAYCFAECKNISKLENLTLSGNIGNASYMFSGSGISTIKNVSTSCGNIVGMFSNCNNLVTVTNFDANGTTSYESLFEGCGGMSVAPVTEIPATITSIKNMYKNCDGLVSIDGFVLHGNITEATGFIEGCDNLINANNVTISGSFYNDIFRGLTSLKYVNNLLINYVGRSMSFAHMFEGCTNLVEMSFHDDSYVKDVISLDYMFAGTSMRTIDFSNVNFEKVTSIKYMFANCIMEEFSYTVPITIMSIQGFLSGCSNLKTLRNFIISTNVSTVDWLADTNVENLIDCSFNTQYTRFTDNTSIKVVENLEYTGTDFSNYFNGCTSLETVSLTLTNTTTKAENAFANCPNLTQIDFADSDLSNVTSINGMFNGDTSLTTINNLKIINNSTTANNTTLVGCPISNTDGLYINSNNALYMFRLGAEAAITAVTDFELGSDADDLSELFMDNPNITHDIVIPSHVYSVEKMYYNCINLTYVTSNWSNIYDLNIDTNPNNEVITTDCYGECTNIKYIDNELYMNEYGELTAIYSIPEEWGGILNCSADQTAFYINSDLLTEYTITLNGSDGNYITEWGDGTTDKRVSHTYSKSGSFRIVTNNTETFGTGNLIPDNFRTAITKVLHLDETITNGERLFEGCTNLLTIKPLTNTFNSCQRMFHACSNIIEIDMSQCTFTSAVNNLYAMFRNCYKVKKILFNVPNTATNMTEMFSGDTSLSYNLSLQIPDSVTSVAYLFNACDAMTDISGTTFGSGITIATSWIPLNLTTANNITVKNNNVNFDGCSTLIEVQNLTITNTVTNLESFLRNCTSLTSFSFNKNSDLSKVTTIKRFLVGNKIISTLDFSGFDLTSLNIMSAVGENQGCIANTNVSYVDFSNCEFGNKNINWIWLTNNCKTQGSITFDFTNAIMPVINFNRFGWNSGSTKHYFKFNGADFKYWTTFAKMFATDATIISGVDFTDAKFSHITDFSDMFNGTGLAQVNRIYITEDIEFPITATNVERAFYGCTKITHVHSNWDKTYTNGITPTDCYAGCTEITHIDGVDIGKSAYVNGLDGIPPEWGGYGMYPEHTTICEFEVDETDLTLVVSNVTSTLTDDGIIDWGDGTITYGEITHTYAEAGTYIVKGKYWFSNANLTWRKYITKLIKGTQQPVSCFNTFAALPNSKITYADFSDMTLTNVSGMCGGDNNSINFETIIFKNTTITTGDLNSFIKTCRIENLDLSGIKFTKPITNLANAFFQCYNLKKLDLSTWDLSYLTTMSSLCSSCSALEEIIFPETHLVTCAEGGGTKLNIQYAFQNTTNLKKLDLSMIYGQVGDLGRFLDGSTSMEEFYVQNLTATTAYMGYSFPYSQQKLIEFRFFKSVTWSNPDSVNVFQNFSLSSFTSISKESLLSFLNALPDITSLTTNVYTLSIGATNMAKLTEDEIVAFTNKGYSLTV